MSKDSLLNIDNTFNLPFQHDDYSDINLSPKAQSRLANLLISSKTALVSSAALICKGPTECPFKERCPIFSADGESATYPLNRQCIVEMNFVQDRYLEYMKELDIQGKASASISYRSQISALVDLDLREFRISLILSGVGGFSDGTLLYNQTIAVNDEGEEIKQLQDHPAWKILSKIRKDRLDLLDAMGLTVKRQVMIKAALKQKDTENFLTRSLELLERVSHLEEANDKDK